MCYSLPVCIEPCLQKAQANSHNPAHTFNNNSGQGWVLSTDVARYLAQGYRRRPRLRTAGPEDAAIAFHLWPFQVSPIHSPDFHGTSEKRGKACSATSLLVHYMTPQLWDAIDPATGALAC